METVEALLETKEIKVGDAFSITLRFKKGEEDWPAGSKILGIQRETGKKQARIAMILIAEGLKVYEQKKAENLKKLKIKPA